MILVFCFKSILKPVAGQIWYQREYEFFLKILVMKITFDESCE